MRRAIPVVRKAGPIAALLVLALAAALVARDAAAIRLGLERGDVAFAADPAAERLWRLETTLPFAERVFDVEDDLAYRRALRAFAVDRRQGTNPYNFFRPAVRAEAQGALSDAERSGLSRDRRAKLVNLLGILALEEAVGDPINGPDLIRQSITEFRRAVRIDPASTEAKYNLEYVLRLMQPGSAKVREGQSLTEYQGRGARPGAGPRREGQGY